MVQKFEKRLCNFISKKKIDYKYYDVYEFNGQCYRNFIKKTVQELKNEGMKLFDNSTVLSIKQDQKTLCFCINVKTLDGEKQFFVRKLVLATGALDIRDILLEKIIGAVPSGFEIGVRIEVPSSSFGNVLSTHGDLKLKYGAGRTYCVTANGRIISYYTDGMQFLEGCAESFLSDDYTNLAVLIKQSDKNAINDFFERYRSIYKGNPIKQKFVDYSRGRASDDEIHTTLASAICGDINNLFSLDINTQINRFIRDVLIDAMGLAEDEITLVAPELKIIRDFQISKNFEISRNLFAIGSMTGRFRGILQSYCSGIRCGQFFRKEVE